MAPVSRARLAAGTVAAAGAVVLAVVLAVALWPRGAPAPTAETSAPAPASAAPATSAPAPVPTTPAPSPSPSPTAPPGLPGDPSQVRVQSADGAVLVDAALQPTLLDPNGVLAPPPGIAGWYAETGWARPGDTGTAILVGHISDGAVPDTFFRLPEVRPGDRITVTYPSGRVTSFVVRRSAAEAKTDVPADTTIWDWQATSPQLRLITCDPTTPIENGHYEGNWVVWADPA